MSRRKSILIGLSVVWVGVLALCATTTFSTLRLLRSGGAISIDGPFSFGLTASAQVTESYTYSAAQSLEVESDFGDISVIAADVDEIQVEVTKEAAGDNEADANARAETLTFTVIERGDTLRLVYDAPTQISLFNTSPERIHFDIKVPTETNVDLDTGLGAIKLAGIEGTAVIDASFGDVDVADIQGTLTVTVHNGKLTARRVKSDGDIELTTSFGTLIAEDLEGHNLTIKVNNGDLTIDGLIAEASIILENRFGDIAITGATAESLKIDTGNGNVTLETGQIAGALTIDNSFGSIRIDNTTADTLGIGMRNGSVVLENDAITDTLTIENSFGEVSLLNVIAASYTLSADNSGLKLDGVSGLLHLDTSFNNITITNATDVTLDATARNGSIFFTGALDPAASHNVATEFGEITLTLPSNSAFDVDIEVSFGEIETDFPITLSGSLNQDHWQGQLNGGGPKLDLDARNGNITLSANES